MLAPHSSQPTDDGSPEWARQCGPHGQDSKTMSGHDHSTVAPGSVVARYCGQCGHPRIATARFCGNCGTPLPVTSSARPSGPASVSSAVTPLSGFLGGVVADVQALPFRTLVPMRAWWSGGVWRQGWTGLFVLAALTPFFLIHFADSATDFKNVSWGFSLYFAFVWFLALYTLIRPQETSWAVLVRVAVFTVLAGVAIAVGLEKHLASGEMNLTKFVFGVGFPEELAKALPVYLFVFRSSRSFDLRGYLFIGAV